MIFKNVILHNHFSTCLLGRQYQTICPSESLWRPCNICIVCYSVLLRFRDSFTQYIAKRSRLSSHLCSFNVNQSRQIIQFANNAGTHPLWYMQQWRPTEQRWRDKCSIPPRIEFSLVDWFYYETRFFFWIWFHCSRLKDYCF